MKTFKFYATVRSGHHSMVYWLLHQCKDAPTNTHCPVNAGRIYIQSPTYNAIWFDNWNHTLNLDSQKPPIPWDVVCVAYEHPKMDEVQNLQLTLDHKPLSSTIGVVLLRDFKNTMASVIGINNNASASYLQNVAKTWASRAEAILNGMFFISFNKYNCDIEYRCQICNDLSLNFTDIGVDYLTPFGGGSSFSRLDHKRFEPHKLNKRYEQVSPKLLLPTINSQIGRKCTELSKEIFGEV